MKNELFDIERAIREANLSVEAVKRLLQDVREEYPDDDLMYELHVIRALQAEVAARLPAGKWEQLVNQRASATSPRRPSRNKAIG